MRQRWQEEWTGGKGDRPLDIQGRVWGWRGAIIVTVIESRAKTGTGSWDHLA